MKKTTLDNQFRSISYFEIKSGETLNLEKLSFNTGGELRMKGGTLYISQIEGGEKFKISGEGTIYVSGSITCGPNSQINLNNIALNLQNPVSKLILGEGSILSLEQYPLTGGTLKSETGITGSNRSSIIAPRNYFFETNQLEDGFRADVAYPEWFVKDININSIEDWASYINKSFLNGYAQVVSLDAKPYNIQTTINVPARCQLRGSSSGITSPHNAGDKDFGTILFASAINLLTTG